MIFKRKGYRCLLLSVLLGINGCSTTGMMTAGHNGKKYWNPGNCSQYTYYDDDPDYLYCLTNGRGNGITLEPVNQQQLDNYYREQEIISRSTGNAGSSYSAPSNTVNCYRMDDIRYNKEIRTFSGMVCPVGWLKQF